MDADAAAARERFRAKMGKGGRTGGKGTMRLKKKSAPKTSAAEEKKLQSHLKRAGVQPFPGIEEVAFLKEDGKALLFKSPRFQGNMNANTYVVSGKPVEMDATELSPEILQGAGDDTLKAIGKEDEAAADGAGEATGAEGIASFDEAD